MHGIKQKLYKEKMKNCIDKILMEILYLDLLMEKILKWDGI